LIANLNTEEILATDLCHGSQHDFQLFKNSRCAISRQTCVLADAGYQGLTGLHPNSQTPAKKSKLHPSDCFYLQFGTQNQALIDFRKRSIFTFSLSQI
jgi:hypothetical protein